MKTEVPVAAASSSNHTHIEEPVILRMDSIEETKQTEKLNRRAVHVNINQRSMSISTSTPMDVLEGIPRIGLDMPDGTIELKTFWI
jgi:hypothetical protein